MNDARPAGLRGAVRSLEYPRFFGAPEIRLNSVSNSVAEFAPK